VLSPDNLDLPWWIVSVSSFQSLKSKGRRVRVQAKEVERTEMFGRDIAIFQQAFKELSLKEAIKLRKDSGVFVAQRESLEVTVAALESGP
jgi:hypothetical protein